MTEEPSKLPRCLTCRRNTLDEESNRVCPGCQKMIINWLASMPARLVAVDVHLHPAPAPVAERVSHTSTDTYTPARMDALTLLGPGSDTNHIRDQVGPTPPAEWLDQQVRAWRRLFGHQVPKRTQPGSPAPPDPGAAARRRVYGQRAAGMRPRSERIDDPLAQELHARYGPMGTSTTVGWDVDYLQTYLQRACTEPEVDIVGFFLELRQLIWELDRVTGAHPDRQRLGRCPSERPDGTACGTSLWQDPFASGVECERCRSAWSSQQLLALAVQMRRVWPYDSQRRYHVDEIDQLPPLCCPQCRREGSVIWSEVTGTRDERRWWRVADARCPHKDCPTDSIDI